MAILQLRQSAVVISLDAVDDSEGVLLDQVRDILPQSRFLVLNIRGVMFTTILIGDIINVYNLFEEHWKDKAHRMVMVHPDPSAKRIFDLTKLTKKIPIYDNVDDALDDLPPVH